MHGTTTVQAETRRLVAATASMAAELSLAVRKSEDLLKQSRRLLSLTGGARQSDAPPVYVTEDRGA